MIRGPDTGGVIGFERRSGVLLTYAQGQVTSYTCFRSFTGEVGTVKAMTREDLVRIK